MKNNIISLSSSIQDFFENFQKLKKNRTSKTSKKKKNDNHFFIEILALTTFIILAKEPIMNLLIISGDYRKPKTEDWVFYASRTKEMLASQIVKNKILIVSGSNGLFGIDAKQIESSTGVPTVNLAVHAGLGADYIVSQAKKILKPGDIVLFPLEFGLYHDSKDDKLIDPSLRNYIISYDHDYLNKLSLIDRLKVIIYPSGINLEDVDIVKKILQNKSPFDKKIVYSSILERRNTGECYTGITLDSNGDETCNIGKSPIKNLKKLGKIWIQSKESIDPSGSLREFCSFAKAHKITIIPLYQSILFFPDYNSDEYKAYFLLLKRFWLEQGILFEDSVGNSFLEEKMMFNSDAHPNDKGRKLRTTNVINILNKHLKNNNIVSNF